jgi:hypothetical protein
MSPPASPQTTPPIQPLVPLESSATLSLAPRVGRVRRHPIVEQYCNTAASLASPPARRGPGATRGLAGRGLARTERPVPTSAARRASRRARTGVSRSPSGGRPAPAAPASQSPRSAPSRGPSFRPVVAARRGGWAATVRTATRSASPIGSPLVWEGRADAGPEAAGRTTARRGTSARARAPRCMLDSSAPSYQAGRWLAAIFPARGARRPPASRSSSPVSRAASKLVRSRPSRRPARVASTASRAAR